MEHMRVPLPSGRAFIYLALVAGLGVSLLPLGSATPLPETTHFFTETGFAVTGRFLAMWQGPYTYEESVAINGYPISDAHYEVSPDDGQIYLVQWFQRARYELHPEQAPPNDVQLGRLGVVAARGRQDQPAFQPVPEPADLGPTRAWYPETQHTLNAAFLAFWTQYGSWKQFGFPISEPLQERNQIDGQTYQVQYFERARFELHPGAAPAFGDVLLGQLGVEQYLDAPGGPPTPAPSPTTPPGATPLPAQP